MNETKTFNLEAISGTEFTCLDLHDAGFAVIMFLVLKE